MHRRTFLATALLAVAAPRAAIATTPGVAPAFATRGFKAIDPSPTDPEQILARVDRLSESSPPFPSNLDALVELGHFDYFGAIRGEYWVGEFETVQAPADLPSPAMFVDFDSSAGVAGFRQEHTLGMFESGGLRWTVQATDGERPRRIRVVTDLALLLEERRAGGTPTPSATSLENLLPTEADFPFPVKPTEAPSSAQ